MITTPYTMTIIRTDGRTGGQPGGRSGGRVGERTDGPMWCSHTLGILKFPQKKKNKMLFVASKTLASLSIVLTIKLDCTHDHGVPRLPALTTNAIWETDFFLCENGYGMIGLYWFVKSSDRL